MILITLGLESMKKNLWILIVVSFISFKQALSTPFIETHHPPIRYQTKDTIGVSSINDTASFNLSTRVVSVDRFMDSLKGADKNLFKEAVDLLKQLKPDEAIVKLFKILKLSSNKDHLDRANILLAEAYREKRENKKGIDLLYTLMEQKNVAHNNMTYAYTRMSALYNEWKYPQESFMDSVIKYSELAIVNAEKYGFDEYLALSENEIGQLLNLKKKYAEAQPRLIKALHLFLNLDMKRDAVNAALNLGYSYLYSKKYKKADEVMDEALLYCNEEGNAYLFMRMYLLKAKINKHLGNYKEGYHYLFRSNDLLEQSFKDRLDAKIVEMVAKYDLKLKEDKIREEKLKREKKQKEVVALMILIGILLLVLILGGIIFYLQRKYFSQKQTLSEMQNQILEKDYELKNKELKTVVAGWVEMDKILEEVKSKIVSKKYKKALSVINASLSGDRKSQKIILDFNEQHPDFLIKLHQHHPNLTDNDTRLCTLLKMGLRSKDIAGILNIAVSSVNKGRQRLRKKLQLKPQEDIASYLERF